MNETQFLVIGAGPYGLAAAAYARSRGIDVQVIGKPMDFWATQMPEGMLLRSGTDWHLDARGTHTFECYLHRRGLTPEQAHPVPLALFSDYALWFMQQYDLSPRPALVRALVREDGAFTATLDDGSQVCARHVLLGLGFGWFPYYPPDVVERLPAGRYSHTCDTVRFDCLKSRRVLIIGGRQSAYEWAALMSECGVAEVHLSHRHPVPNFVETDWSWAQPMVQATVADHAWWRNSPSTEQEAIRRRFWEAGRLKLEPWLAPRVHRANIRSWEKTRLVACETSSDGALAIRLSNGAQVQVDHVLLATGYQVNMPNVTFLDRATLLDTMQLADGYPALDPEFQTTVPGLYVSGFAATRDFGPFFGFVVGCAVAARVIGDAVADGGRG
jgi:cation diffusion facilitator CzcD-associated flavoprotein CzcO